MSNQVPKEMEEADRLAREAVSRISEHVDAVSIFVTKKREDGKEGTWRMTLGAGNWYARYGHVRQWLLAEEGLTFNEPEEEEGEDIDGGQFDV